jgi:cardiolipin synthase
MAESGEDRVLTIPNALSVGRLACVPVFLWLLFGKDDPHAAALLLAALGITDWVDGYVARHLHQVSNLGKVLDPVADRVLLIVGVVAILVHGNVPVWVAVLALSRELLVAGATLALAALGARRIDVTWFGKAGTFLLMVSFPLFLASDPTVGWHATARTLAWATALPGLVLSWYAVATYVPLARAALAHRAEPGIGGPARPAPVSSAPREDPRP